MARTVSAAEYLEAEAQLITRFLDEGLTQGDAQACAEAELWKRFGVTEFDVASADPMGWVLEGQRREARIERGEFL